MKILFTGATAKQTSDTAHERARVKRIDDSSIICDSLRKQGFTVDRKTVKWGDDLSEYDLAIVGASVFGSLNSSGQVFNSFYPLTCVPNCLVFFEDWKIDSVMNGYEAHRDLETLKKSAFKKRSETEFFYGGVDNPKFDVEKLHEVMIKLANGEYDAIIPAFDWGNKQLVRDIIKSKNIYNLDLTPYVLDGWNIRTDVEQKPKQKKHVLASLVDHSSWVKRNKLKWDVDYFGAKSMKAPQLESETEVFHKCGDYWSILCPEYPHAGSGWFRIRWIYAAIWKSVILSSQKDMEALGLPKVDVEKLDEKELEEYAITQSESILKHMWSKEDFDKAIHDIVMKNSTRLTKNTPQMSLLDFF